MRILLIAGSLPPMKCGVGDYCFNLARALAAIPDVRVGVLTSTLAEAGNAAGKFDLFPIIDKWSFLELFKVIRAIRSWSPTIVHIQYPTQGYGEGFLPWVLPILAFLMRKVVVQTWHEGYSRRAFAKLFLKSIVPGGLVFVRPQYKDCLHSQLRWALWGKRASYIPNASAIPRAELNNNDKIELRQFYLKKQRRLVVFFGFVYPHKGVELLFDIADPDIDQIVIAGELDENGEYRKEILARASLEAWNGKVTLTGFLSLKDVASLLAVADAVVLPFRTGAGEWNTSIHGAVSNGAFVLTTSLAKNGYDEKRNLYFARVDDVDEMKSALERYAGNRRKYDEDIDRDEWASIASSHILLYSAL